MTLRVIPDTDEQVLASERDGDYAYTDSYKVVSSTPNPGIFAVQAAVGVYNGNPGKNGTVCRNVRVRGSDDRYLFRVTAEFARRETVENPLGKKDRFTWVGSIGGTRPFLKALGDPKATGNDRFISTPDGTDFCVDCTNAADDPLEGLVAETSEARLRIVGARPVFNRSLAMVYVNSVNLKPYADGEPYTWKCISVEGTEAEAQIDNGAGGTTTLEYWQVSVDLAYRAEGWATPAWDFGLNESFVTNDGKFVKRKICVPRADKIPGWADATEVQRAAWIEQYRASDPQPLFSYSSEKEEERKKAGQAKPEGEPPTEIKLYSNIARDWTGIFPEPPA
jgi:hypothetical protein